MLTHVVGKLLVIASKSEWHFESANLFECDPPNALFPPSQVCLSSLWKNKSLIRYKYNKWFINNSTKRESCYPGKHHDRILFKPCYGSRGWAANLPSNWKRDCRVSHICSLLSSHAPRYLHPTGQQLHRADDDVDDEPQNLLNQCRFGIQSPSFEWITCPNSLKTHHIPWPPRSELGDPLIEESLSPEIYLFC